MNTDGMNGGIKCGMMARSKAGHDSGQLYVIIGEDHEYVYLVNGKNRTIQNPKRKKKKHIQPVLKFSSLFLELEKEQKTLRDEDIKRIIKSEKKMEQ